MIAAMDSGGTIVVGLGVTVAVLRILDTLG